MINTPKKFRRIGILTSGGDAPGMNAAVRAVARAAIKQGVEVMAIYEGYKGLIENNMKLFGSGDVSNIINIGGTILYSARCVEFKEEEYMQKAIENCRKNQIDGIVALGGDGTFRGATDLTVRGIPCIGIPCTIDNDITSTDYSIGYDTAMNTVIEMVDRLRDTCESHARCNVVEVMGNGAGWIALETGIATGASVIVLRELPFDEEAAMQKLIAAKNDGKRSFIFMIAEGVPLELEKQGIKGYSEDLAKRIQKVTGIETKFARLAHVVRGGSPTLRDRVIASEMAYKAVELLLAGESNKVVCMSKGDVVSMDIGYALMLDRMYKGKLKDGDLDKYTPEQVEDMHKYCDGRMADFKRLYQIADDISR